MTATGSNQAQGKVETYFVREVWGGWRSNQVPTYIGQSLQDMSAPAKEL